MHPTWQSCFAFAKLKLFLSRIFFVRECHCCSVLALKGQLVVWTTHLQISISYIQWRIQHDGRSMAQSIRIAMPFRMDCCSFAKEVKLIIRKSIWLEVRPYEAIYHWQRILWRPLLLGLSDKGLVSEVCWHNIAGILYHLGKTATWTNKIGWSPKFENLASTQDKYEVVVNDGVQPMCHCKYRCIREFLL